MSQSDEDLPELRPGSLSAVLDSDPACRNRLRTGNKGKLMRWQKNDKGIEMVGHASMPHIAMNVRVLTLLAKYWCPKAKKSKTVKSPSIDLLRAEARSEVKTVALKKNSIVVL